MTVTGTAESAVTEVRASRPARGKKLAWAVLPPVAALVAWLDQLQAHWDEQLQSFKRHVERKQPVPDGRGT